MIIILILAVASVLSILIWAIYIFVKEFKLALLKEANLRDSRYSSPVIVKWENQSLIPYSKNPVEFETHLLQQKILKSILLKHKKEFLVDSNLFILHYLTYDFKMLDDIIIDYSIEEDLKPNKSGIIYSIDKDCKNIITEKYTHSKRLQTVRI